MVNHSIKAEIHSLPVPKIFVFDLDLTLHNVIDHYDYVMLETFRHFGLKNVTIEELRHAVENSVTTKAIIGAFLPEEKIEQAFQYYSHHFLSREIPIRAILPGAQELLKKIKQEFKLPILGITNSEEATSKKILHDLDMLQWFDYVIGIRDDHLPKPNSQMLVKALAFIGEKPSPSVWFVGDRASDTLCAKQNNCTAIRYYHEILPHDENADLFISCHFVFSGLISQKLKNVIKIEKK